MPTRRTLNTEINQLADANTRLTQDNTQLRDHNAQLAQHNADLTKQVITLASEVLNALARAEKARHAHERELESAHRMVRVLAEDRLDRSKTGTAAKVPTQLLVSPAPTA